MIRHLVMNMTQNLNLFPAKCGVSAHYIPHIILSQSNWYYNKHCQVGFCSYVHSWQVNYPENPNLPRTLDGIYLRPATNLQGRHHIMNLQTGQFITRQKLVEITIIDVIINYVEKMVEEQVFKSLKYIN